jgi:RimJ/RimL family protein N-acetyltransferase
MSVLRKVTDADNYLLRKWRNANREFFPPAPPITAQSQQEWWAQYVRRPHDHMYLVCPENRLYRVGTVAIDVRDRMLHRVLRGRPEGPGVMTQAVYELLDLYGEGNYTLQVLEGNDRALKFYEKIGFRVSGRQQNNPLDPQSPMLVNMFLEYHL